MDKYVCEFFEKLSVGQVYNVDFNCQSNLYEKGQRFIPCIILSVFPLIVCKRVELNQHYNTVKFNIYGKKYYFEHRFSNALMINYNMLRGMIGEISESDKGRLYDILENDLIGNTKTLFRIIEAMQEGRDIPRDLFSDII